MRIWENLATKNRGLVIEDCSSATPTPEAVRVTNQRPVAQISFSLPRVLFRGENILDKSKAQLQAITKLACGSNRCNR